MSWSVSFNNTKLTSTKLTMSCNQHLLQCHNAYELNDIMSCDAWISSVL